MWSTGGLRVEWSPATRSIRVRVPASAILFVFFLLVLFWKPWDDVCFVVFVIVVNPPLTVYEYAELSCPNIRPQYAWVIAGMRGNKWPFCKLDLFPWFFWSNNQLFLPSDVQTSVTEALACFSKSTFLLLHFLKSKNEHVLLFGFLSFKNKIPLWTHWHQFGTHFFVAHSDEFVSFNNFKCQSLSKFQKAKKNKKA